MISVIGIDCACDPQKVGLATAVFSKGRISIEEVRIGSKTDSPVDVISAWLERRRGRTLLALDAPLGWPENMAAALMRHRAGTELPVQANHLFRRATDRFIQSRIGKTPLDVGADKIARTAHAALSLLTQVRERTGQLIPLAWDASFSGIAAIEVYPAATVASRFPRELHRYKGKNSGPVRDDLLDAISRLLNLPKQRDLLLTSIDALDAVLCTLAGGDFLRGEAVPPENTELAEREGWIWVRAPRLT
jgi:predicted RNase H-like nuclease